MVSLQTRHPPCSPFCGAPAVVAACPPAVPAGLTIPEEDDEVFGFVCPGLDLEAGLDGRGCLIVPEGWVLLLDWEGAAPVSPRAPSPGRPRAGVSAGFPLIERPPRRRGCTNPMGRGAGKGGGSPRRLHPPRKVAGWQEKGMQWEEPAAKWDGGKYTGVKGLQAPHTAPPRPKTSRNLTPWGETSSRSPKKQREPLLTLPAPLHKPCTLASTRAARMAPHIPGHQPAACPHPCPRPHPCPQSSPYLGCQQRRALPRAPGRGQGGPGAAWWDLGTCNPRRWSLPFL